MIGYQRILNDQRQIIGTTDEIKARQCFVIATLKPGLGKTRVFSKKKPAQWVFSGFFRVLSGFFSVILHKVHKMIFYGNNMF